jgi:2-methylfumaryl-CoA hydratase
MLQQPTGNFFEDLELGRVIKHGTPRTVSEGDISLFIALTGSRNPISSSKPLALALGYRDRPLDDLLTFNMVFGKTVPDISVNAVANLGYADMRFSAPAYPGDTISVTSEVIGRRETSDKKAGVVYVRTQADAAEGHALLSYNRWVLVKKRSFDVPAGGSHVPNLPLAVPDTEIPIVSRGDRQALFEMGTQIPRFWASYNEGARINHPAGAAIGTSEHMLATRLYQNTAAVHFDAIMMRETRQSACLVYGGHVMSVCRALSYDGLENVLAIAAINSGNHTAPTYAGDTLYSATEILRRFELPGRQDVGGLRLRLWGVKNQRPGSIPSFRADNGKVHPAVVLELDYTVIIPR